MKTSVKYNKKVKIKCIIYEYKILKFIDNYILHSKNTSYLRS